MSINAVQTNNFLTPFPIHYLELGNQRFRFSIYDVAEDRCSLAVDLFLRIKNGTVCQHYKYNVFFKMQGSDDMYCFDSVHKTEAKQMINNTFVHIKNVFWNDQRLVLNLSQKIVRNTG